VERITQLLARLSARIGGANGAGAVLEPLEARSLLSAISWTGMGTDTLWSNSDNWSGGVVPGPADDVLIDAGAANPTVRFTSDAGAATVRSLRLNESMIMTGGSLRVSTTSVLRSSLTVMGGTIGGGAWDSTVGPIFFTGGATGTIAGGTSFTGSITTINNRVRVMDSFSLAGTMTVNGSGIDFFSDITFESGTFVLINGRLGLGGGVATRTMTIGTAATVRGYGSVGNALFSENVTTNLINRGTIIADQQAKFMVIAGAGAFTSAFTNQSVVRATDGGIARIAATQVGNYSEEGYGTLTGGTWRADASSTVMLDYSRVISVNQSTVVLGGTNAAFSNMMDSLRTNNGSIELGPGMQWTNYNSFSNNGTITLGSISSLSLPVAGTHTGTFNIGLGSVMTTTGFSHYASSARFVGSGTLILSSGLLEMHDMFGPTSNVTLSIGRNAVVTLAESVHLGSIENNGQLGLATYVASLSGGFTQSAGGATTADMKNATTIGCIDARGTASLSGSMVISSSTGFDPAKEALPNFTAVLVRGSVVTGYFRSTAQPSVEIGAYLWINTGNSLELWHNIADFNGDGGVDGGDLESFLTSWELGLPINDINGDGGVDGADLEAFVTIWQRGGR